MDKEFELKLAISTDSAAKLHQLLISKGGLRRTRLQAFYIDTDDFFLSKKNIALRVRKEGRYWVQTLKMPGRNEFERLEHNVKLAGWDASKPIDITLHAQHPAGVELMTLIEKNPTRVLTVQFQTDIWRRVAAVRARQGIIEYALDEGVISTQSQQGLIEIPVCEIELELKSGSYDSVIAHAKTLINRYGACLDTRSKSQRGFLAAQGEYHAKPIRGDVFSLNRGYDSQIVSSIIASCLHQILGNASEMNAGLEKYDEHLHQLRVGLRRLKSALKVLALINIGLTEKEIEVLSVIFSKLGLYRDSNYLTEKLNPDLLAVNGPAVNIPDQKKQVHPQTFLSAKPFQLLLLELLNKQLEHQEHEVDDLEKKNLKALSLAMLTKLHKACKKIAAQFQELPEEQRHELRKKLKRFRYTLEFFYEFLDGKANKVFSKELRTVLEHLGDYNDICVAIESIHESLDEHTPHWFALGWLKAEQKRVEHLSEVSLNRFFDLKRIW